MEEKSVPVSLAQFSQVLLSFSSAIFTSAVCTTALANLCDLKIEPDLDSRVIIHRIFVHMESTLKLKK